VKGDFFIIVAILTCMNPYGPGLVDAKIPFQVCNN
jgi:hypothetical protein